MTDQQTDEGFWQNVSKGLQSMLGSPTVGESIGVTLGVIVILMLFVGLAFGVALTFMYFVSAKI